MPGNTKISGTSLTGHRCPYIHLPAFFPRTSWPRRVQSVWPQWWYQPWPQLWIDPSSLIGHSVQSEPCVTTWTGPQISGSIRSWSLSPSRKVLTRISHLPLSPHGSNKLWSYAMTFQTRRPTHYIRSKPMMSGPLLLLRHSKLEFPWNRSCQHVIGSHIIPSHNFIWRMWLGLTLSSITWDL